MVSFDRLRAKKVAIVSKSKPPATIPMRARENEKTSAASAGLRNVVAIKYNEVSTKSHMSRLERNASQPVNSNRAKSKHESPWRRPRAKQPAAARTSMIQSHGSRNSSDFSSFK